MIETIEGIFTENAALISVTSLVLTMTSIVLALVIYKASKPLTSIAYAARTFRIISDKASSIDGLSINFNSISVDTLSVTRLAIWNEGNQALRESDLPEIDAPAIRVKKGVEVFAITLVEQPEQTNQFVLLNNNEIRFQHINPGDGALINVIHSGTEINDVFISGSIIGGRVRNAAMDPETVNISADPHAASTILITQSPRTHGLFLAYLSLALAAIALVGSFFSLIPAIFVSGGFFTVGLFFLWDTRRRYPPAQIRMFDDNF